MDAAEKARVEGAARNAAKEAPGKAAEEGAGKSTEENTSAEVAKAAAPEPEPASPPDAKPPEDSARLAEEMRRERARLEAEAERIEAQRKAAEAKRLADERAKEEALREDARRRAEAAANEKHRFRRIILIPEPIPMPIPQTTAAIPLSPKPSAGNSRPADYASARGPLVKRWVRRRPVRTRCRHAGRRVALPGHYTVRAGDSLWRISRRHYRSGWLYWKIYRANRSIVANPNRIYPCQRLFVPPRR
jgi:nucleoid-associated protein YgaU